jgi:hypothetical protein
VTPPCDGVQFAAHSVSSDLAGFEVDFEVAPNLGGAGAPNDWSGSNDRVQGTMRYWPALDPHAKRLDLLVCVETHQAVVSISLGEDGKDGP